MSTRVPYAISVTHGDAEERGMDAVCLAAWLPIAGFAIAMLIGPEESWDAPSGEGD